MVNKISLKNILFVMFISVCVLFVQNIKAEVIRTNDPVLLEKLKEMKSIPAEKPATKRNPNEIFTDKKLISLVDASVHGHVKDVRTLVAAGVNVNAKGWRGLTPLFSALNAKNRKGVEVLLELGANPNDISDYYGRAPIHDAVDSIEDPYFLKAILKNGGNPNLPEMHGLCRLPLSMAAAIHNDSKEAEQKIRMLVNAGADLNRINTTCDLSRTAVEPSTILVSSLPRYDLTYIMLEIGADPSLASSNGLTLRKAMENTKGWRMTKEQAQWKEKVISFLQEKGAW